MSKLNEKVIWVTGASSGIGEALAYNLSHQGAKLIISARRLSELERVKQNCSHPDQVHCILLDLADTDSIPAIAKEAISIYGYVDILLNNGGISQRSLIKDTQLEVDRRVMEVNYFGTVALTKAVLPSMIERKSGHMVVVTSMVGIIATKFRSGYTASKHALHGFFDTLRIEHHQDNIDVSIVCPGFTQTAITMNALMGDGKPQLKMDSVTKNGMPVDKCARLIVKAIANRKEEVYISGPKEKFGAYMKRFFPRLFSKFIRNAKVT
jgi:dehydrogenase/reductase SDR family protein 7B